MAEYKIIVVGSGGVGKSALTIQYIQQTFVERYDPTIEDSYRKQVEVDGSAVMLDILDTAGQVRILNSNSIDGPLVRYHSLAGEYMGKGHGFVIVYSITDVQTYEDTPKYYEEILKAKAAEEGEKVPIILVGNKLDLEEERAVSQEEGVEQAKKFGDFCKCIETSAKTRENVDSVFEELVRMINAVEGVEDEPLVEAQQTTQPTGDQQESKTSSNPKPKPKKKKCIIL